MKSRQCEEVECCFDDWYFQVRLWLYDDETAYFIQLSALWKCAAFICLVSVSVIHCIRIICLLALFFSCITTSPTILI